jgi:hypothetical protein
MAGHIEISVRGYFTSDSAEVDIAPRLSIRSTADEQAGKFASSLCAAMRAGVDIPAFLRQAAGSDMRITDWRPMTNAEVIEYLANERDEES